MKCLADCTVGIILRLEICDGKEDESRGRKGLAYQHTHSESVSPGMENDESSWQTECFIRKNVRNVDWV